MYPLKLKLPDMMGDSVAHTAVAATVSTVVGFFALYAAFIAVLAIPAVHKQVIYLNNIKLTWGQDVNYPEQWGFLHNQVTPFRLHTSDGEDLHAWHILPIGLYLKHEAELVSQPAGVTKDITLTKGFQLLRDDPEAQLVIYFHGAAGTLGSGYRPPSYRAISAASPKKIHIVTIDYRGFGTSTGKPSEKGLMIDARMLVDWAINTAGIPPSRIVLFSQSLGTAVSISLMEALSKEANPISLRGAVLVAPFADVKTLTATYKVAGTIPLLSPLARVPKLLDYLNTFIHDKWPSKDRLASFIRCHETETELTSPSSSSASSLKYWVNIIHAEDDWDIPSHHSELLYWHAYNATLDRDISFEDLDLRKGEEKIDLGAGGRTVERRTRNGYIREDILKYGLHDRTMGYPVVSRAIHNAFTHPKSSAPEDH